MDRATQRRGVKILNTNEFKKAAKGAYGAARRLGKLDDVSATWSDPQNGQACY